MISRLLLEYLKKLIYEQMEQLKQGKCHADRLSSNGDYRAYELLKPSKMVHFLGRGVCLLDHYFGAL